VKELGNLTEGEPDGDFIPGETREDGDMMKLILSNQLLWMSRKEASSELPIDHSGICQTQPVLQICMLPKTKG